MIDADLCMLLADIVEDGLQAVFCIWQCLTRWRDDLLLESEQFSDMTCRADLLLPFVKLPNDS